VHKCDKIIRIVDGYEAKIYTISVKIALAVKPANMTGNTWAPILHPMLINPLMELMMPAEDLSLIRIQAWEFICKGQYDLALQLIHGPMQAKKKHKPDMIAMYGCCTAMVLRKRKEGIALVKKAVSVDQNNPSIYFLLGLSYMASDLRRLAMEAFEEGLKLDPHHRPINNAIAELGKRRRPPIPILPRDNPLNIMIGKKLHQRRMRNKDK